MMRPVLVTGASGNTGREVIRSLHARGAPVRCAERRPSDPDAVALDFFDPATFGSAVENCRAVFLLRPPPISNTKATLNPFVDAARAAGVERIVFLSVAGAETNRIVPHHAVEQHLMGGPRDWTILRPGFFAQNIGTAYRADIVEDNRIYVPAGDGCVAFVDLRDVGEVAAAALTEPGHAGRGYTLTGSRAFTFYDVAYLLTGAVGRPIRYQHASVLGYARHLRRQGLSLPHLAVQTVLHVGLRFGQAETVDPTLERLLGRRPHDIGDYIRDHTALWTGTHEKQGG